MAIAVAGCGAGDDSAALPIDAGAAPDVTPRDATPRDATTPPATLDALPASTFGYVRLAQWSADTPAIDFCLAPAGSGAFGSPLLSASFAPPSDGGSVGVPFQWASAYMRVATGNFDVHLIAASSTDCASPLAELSGWTLTSDARSTLAAIGSSSSDTGTDSALRILPLGDDVTAPFVASEGGTGFTATAALRFIQADPYLGEVTLWTGPIDTPFAPFKNVAFSSLSDTATAGGPVDHNGYAAVPPLLPSDWLVTKGIYDSGMDYALLSGAAVAAGAVVTVALVARPDASIEGGLPAQIVECVDSSGTLGALGNCTASP